MPGVQTCALPIRSEEHTSELQSHANLVCRLLLEKKNPSSCWTMKDRSRAEEGFMPRAERRGGPAEFLNRTATRRLVSSRTGRTSTLFFNDTATTEIYTLSLHDALPI